MKCYSDWLKLKTTKDKQRKGGKLVAERKKQLWPSGSTMNVKFGHIKNWRDEDGEPITKDAILKIANKWHECNPQVVPKFIPCGPDNTDSDIRVEFVGRYIPYWVPCDVIFYLQRMGCRGLWLVLKQKMKIQIIQPWSWI